MLLATKKIRKLAKIFNFLTVASLASYLVALWLHSDLPPEESIQRHRLREPIQRSQGIQPSHTVNYRGSEYVLYPKASYQLTGLIVSHNDITSITDAYHTADSFDSKDICVVWGENADVSLLSRIKFWSEPWTCFMQTEDPEAYSRFNPEQLSNNHLVSSSPTVLERIRSLRRGDQVQLLGQLVDYHPRGASELLRKTSLVRDDTGNGACEVIQVEELQVLARHRPWTRIVQEITFPLLIIFIAMSICLFLFTTWAEMRAITKEAEKPIDYRLKYNRKD